jgi:protein-S-isoprenylcysteine O-methyltransferase Ste14
MLRPSRHLSAGPVVGGRWPSPRRGRMNDAGRGVQANRPTLSDMIGRSALHVRPRVPRRAAVAIWTTGIVAVHAVLPIAIARRRRTVASRNRAARFVGVGCLLAGTSGLAWSLAQHFEAAPHGGYELFTFAPEYLLRNGPYRFSRNPMSMSEILVWSGWSLLFADPVLAALSCGLLFGLNRAARLEEAALEARFGQTWEQYAARTPRWVGTSWL